MKLEEFKTSILNMDINKQLENIIMFKNIVKKPKI